MPLSQGGAFPWRDLTQTTAAVAAARPMIGQLTCIASPGRRFAQVFPNSSKCMFLFCCRMFAL